MPCEQSDGSKVKLVDPRAKIANEDAILRTTVIAAWVLG